MTCRKEVIRWGGSADFLFSVFSLPRTTQNKIYCNFWVWKKSESMTKTQVWLKSCMTIFWQKFPVWPLKVWQNNFGYDEKSMTTQNRVFWGYDHYWSFFRGPSMTKKKPMPLPTPIKCKVKTMGPLSGSAQQSPSGG